MHKVPKLVLRWVGNGPESKNYVGSRLDYFGLVAGFIGSKIVNNRGEGLVLDLVLGIVGAIAGGWLFNLFGASGVTGLNLYSLLVAVVGAIAALVVYHAIRRAA